MREKTLNVCYETNRVGVAPPAPCRPLAIAAVGAGVGDAREEGRPGMHWANLGAAVRTLTSGPNQLLILFEVMVRVRRSNRRKF